MPRKDRLKTCSNPFNLFHKNPRKILPISTVLFIDCQNFVPSFNISSQSLLCFECRTELYHRINEARRIAEGGQVQQQRASSSTDVATTSGGSRFSGFVGIPFLLTGIKRKKIETITSEDSPVDLDETTSHAEIPSDSNLAEPHFDVLSEYAVGAVSTYGSAQSESSVGGPSCASIVTSGISEAPLVDLNLKFVTTGISPAKRGDLLRPGVMTSKLNRSAAAIEQNVKAAMQRFSSSPATLRKECMDCKSLLEGMKERLSELTDKRLRYFLLTCAPSSMSAPKLQSAVNCTEHEARKAIRTRDQKGIFQHPEWISPGHSLHDDIKRHVREVYLDNEYGRASPNAQETILVPLFDTLGNRKTERVAKRRMLLNLNELYQVFTEKHQADEIKISSFAALRPKQCIWPGVSAKHNVCTCIIHENFKFMIEATQTQQNVGDYVRRFICFEPEKNCYMGLCDKCPTYEQLNLLDDFFEAGDVTYQKWESSDRMNISSKTVSVETFKTKMKDSLVKVARHHYIMKQQQEYIRNLKDRVKSGKTRFVGMVKEVTVTDDDSEFRLQIMKQARNTNSFTWPDPEKYATFNFNEVISKVEAPRTATGRLYYLSEQDFLKLK
ncbi:unnamed protein product [Allacma fusca]|uniref:Uncharacterized protein n=1 Tax=Allacma fusca TaxID=39272 RepID=A0A8J2P1H7_9HEXA|nr:unnamed protein product [Allacma fusca]